MRGLIIADVEMMDYFTAAFLIAVAVFMLAGLWALVDVLREDASRAHKKETPAERQWREWTNIPKK